MIQKIEINEIPGRRTSYNNDVATEVEQFHKSDWAACEVNAAKYKSVHSATAAYRQAIKNLKLDIIAIEREGRLFLVRGNK